MNIENGNRGRASPFLGIHNGIFVAVQGAGNRTDFKHTTVLKATNALRFFQGCGSGSGLDPYLIGSVDPDPDSESGSGSGSRRAKMIHKS